MERMELEVGNPKHGHKAWSTENPCEQPWNIHAALESSGNSFRPSRGQLGNAQQDYSTGW